MVTVVIGRVGLLEPLNRSVLEAPVEPCRHLSTMLAAYRHHDVMIQ